MRHSLHLFLQNWVDVAKNESFFFSFFKLWREGKHLFFFKLSYFWQIFFSCFFYLLFHFRIETLYSVLLSQLNSLWTICRKSFSYLGQKRWRYIWLFFLLIYHLKCTINIALDHWIFIRIVTQLFFLPYTWNVFIMKYNSP